MKRFSIVIILFFLCFSSVHSQGGPKLQLTGNKSFVQKGTIDTDVLTAIIQAKQEEIKQRVFRNTIVRQFNNYSYKKRLNNFTTYNYLYNLMDELTSGKNKTVMTKSMLERSSEFAFVYGLTLFADKSQNDSTKVKIIGNRGTSIQTHEVNIFNIRMDMCLDILLNEDIELLKSFKFKETLDNKYYASWYNNDNAYLKVVLENKDGAKTYWEAERVILKDKIEAFSELVTNLENLVDGVTNSEDLERDFLLFLSSVNNKTTAEINTAISDFETDLGFSLGNDIKANILGFQNYISDNSEIIVQLYAFYKGLEKSNFKDFTMNKSQYDAMKFILMEFIDLARNQYINNDVISSVLEFLIEYTLIEFTDSEGLSILENKAEEDAINSKGYLYMDVPSLITAIDANLGSIKRKGVLNYITPFFSIGTNYASFNSGNNLTSDSNGNVQDLNDLYFASEKIGLKWKLWNWKYTHSFEPGEAYNYYGYKKRSWRRPQQEPLLSDFYVMAYGSGLLYNLVDLKSEDGFNYAIFGAGVGFTFFNGLALNVGYASPMVDKKLDNGFLNIGLDIPIIEYISALNKKNQ